MIRKELEPPSINSELKPVVEELIEAISEELENNSYDVDENGDFIFEDEEAEQINVKLSKLKELTKKDIEIMDIYHYWNHVSLEDLVAEFLMPEPPCLKDITLEELTEIIERFFYSEDIELYHQPYYIELIEKNFGLSDISDYIFYPDSKGIDIDGDSYEIAEKIIEDSKNPPIISL